jgi:hypothetical protein
MSLTEIEIENNRQIILTLRQVCFTFSKNILSYDIMHDEK